MRIRKETPADHKSVEAIHDAAFKGPAEAGLVRALRPTALASLVAEVDGAIAGHVLFFPLPLLRGDERMEAVGLAPLAVRPDSQRTGIGSALTRAGLERLDGYPLVVVLGDPAYYGRFGFSPGSGLGLTSRYADAGDAFQALELIEGALKGGGWTTVYPAAFDAV